MDEEMQLLNSARSNKLLKNRDLEVYPIIKAANQTSLSPFTDMHKVEDQHPEEFDLLGAKSV